MRNSLSIINWPLRASTAPTELVRATHPQTPYQPHNGYKKEYEDRKRLVNSLVGLAFALLSLVASITLYILVGVERQKVGWLFRAWIAVSAGLSALLGLFAASYYYNHVRSKRAEDKGGERGTQLRALGRSGEYQGSRGGCEAASGLTALQRSNGTASPSLTRPSSGIPGRR
jgi:hypothetical protein